MSSAAAALQSEDAQWVRPRAGGERQPEVAGQVFAAAAGVCRALLRPLAADPPRLLAATARLRTARAPYLRRLAAQAFGPVLRAAPPAAARAGIRAALAGAPRARAPRPPAVSLSQCLPASAPCSAGRAAARPPLSARRGAQSKRRGPARRARRPRAGCWPRRPLARRAACTRARRACSPRCWPRTRCRWPRCATRQGGCARAPPPAPAHRHAVAAGEAPAML